MFVSHGSPPFIGAMGAALASFWGILASGFQLARVACERTGLWSMFIGWFPNGRQNVAVFRRATYKQQRRAQPRTELPGSASCLQSHDSPDGSPYLSEDDPQFSSHGCLKEGGEALVHFQLPGSEG